MDPQVIASVTEGQAVIVLLTEFLAEPPLAAALPTKYTFSGVLSDRTANFPSDVCELRGDGEPIRGQVINVTRSDLNVGGEFVLAEAATAPITEISR